MSKCNVNMCPQMAIIIFLTATTDFHSLKTCQNHVAKSCAVKSQNFHSETFNVIVLNLFVDYISQNNKCVSFV